MPTKLAPELDADRRQAPRRRVLKAAKIFVEDGSIVFDCTIKDISSTGARLSLGQFQPLPRYFQLAIKDFGTFNCQVIRAAGREYGVRFITETDE